MSDASRHSVMAIPGGILAYDDAPETPDNVCLSLNVNARFSQKPIGSVMSIRIFAFV